MANKQYNVYSTGEGDSSTGVVGGSKGGPTTSSSHGHGPSGLDVQAPRRVHAYGEERRRGGTWTMPIQFDISAASGGSKPASLRDELPMRRGGARSGFLCLYGCVGEAFIPESRRVARWEPKQPRGSKARNRRGREGGDGARIGAKNAKQPRRLLAGRGEAHPPPYHRSWNTGWELSAK
jgi:hypothetical protein